MSYAHSPAAETLVEGVVVASMIASPPVPDWDFQPEVLIVAFSMVASFTLTHPVRSAAVIDISSSVFISVSLFQKLEGENAYSTHRE